MLTEYINRETLRDLMYTEAFENCLDAIPAADVVERPEWISKERLYDIFQADREGRLRIAAKPIEDTCGSCRWFEREEGTASGKCTRRTKKFRGGMDSGETLYVSQSHKACKSDYERRADNA